MGASPQRTPCINKKTQKSTPFEKQENKKNTASCKKA